ncbi:hypothetical protein QA646_08610 [Rhizobium sp. CB3090]|uniref:hypothetical protein n=1 Tax=Rhizobium sp. CB3090 TaxID=3039156 RepID=UPI0024B0C215|nr:hypothetical protein [Rhizobium sp. CB3090]WFU10884.1 hypothetical protein QA646_08610 [Rhizobium sp. CB3090]
MHSVDPSSEFEPDYYLRRHRTKGSSYCVPVNPYPGECLEDLLIRAACENGFHPAMSCKLLALSKGITKRSTPGIDRYGITAEALSVLLGNAKGPDELRPLLHTYSPPAKYLRPFFDVWLDKKFFSPIRRVSPLALREAPYLRSIWRVWPIGFDPETKEILLQDCPICRRQLGYKFMGDIWCCDQCSRITPEGKLLAVDLREHPQDLVEECYWENLDFATSFVDPGSRNKRAGFRSELHADFDNLRDGEVFGLMVALSKIISDKKPTGPRLQISACDLAVAAEIVRGWPAAFEEKLLYQTEKATFPSAKSLFFNTRLDARIRSSMKQLVRTAKIRSGLSEISFQVSKLTAFDVEYPPFRKWIARRVADCNPKLLAEAVVLRSRADVRQFTKHIGVSVPSLMAMASGGLLPLPDSEESTKSTFAIAARDFVHRLASNSSKTHLPIDAIQLRRVVSALFNRTDDPWGRIFNWLLSGRVRYWWTRSVSFSALERLYIQDLDGLSLLLAEQNEETDSWHKLPLSKREFYTSTGLNTFGFQNATTAGLVTPPFTAESIMKFRSEFELSSLLGVRVPSCTGGRLTRSILIPMLSAGVEPVMTYSNGCRVWRRSDVERYFGAALIPCIE